MIIVSTMRSGSSHLSSTIFFLCSRFFVYFLMQHIQNLKYLFMGLHNHFIIDLVALKFSMQDSHSYKLLPLSSSIRICLIISHVDMKTYDLLFMDVRFLIIFYKPSPHIRTKVVFMYLLFCKKCACNNYC
jgi:hypothetical protein